MLNDDKNRLSDDQNLADNNHAEPSDHPAESIAVTLGNPLQPESRRTTKPHRNTGSLDSLGGGRLP
ncbi:MULTISPECIES: hypothetical protein [Pseudomonas]|uniref:Uncharacterized protein n=1 Tax=Pseudomonas fluorescens R124 TaxID=743713 RepID=A0A7U9CLG1_PSEFL|nr:MULTISPECIES: hypothetical protein [Pseudomonas]EJZ57465.1 hypothetical protein I1A_001785 [Pseudomonas fluorescens R124]